MELLNSLAETFWRIWPHLFFVTYVSLMVIASAHLVMYKKDTRAAIGWIGVVLMVPIFGALLYAVLGINRLQRRALNLRGGTTPRVASAGRYVTDRRAFAALPSGAKHLTSLERLIHELTGRPLLGGNRVKQLVGGQEAYPQMLAAINQAKRSVALSTYIFDNDRAGAMFAEALEARACSRRAGAGHYRCDRRALYVSLDCWPLAGRGRAACDLLANLGAGTIRLLESS